MINTACNEESEKKTPVLYLGQPYKSVCSNAAN